MRGRVVAIVVIAAFAVAASFAGCSRKADGAGKAVEPLYAVFQTSMGDIKCRLFEKEAPITVKNFTELALGKKEWMIPGGSTWARKPLYDGTIFHRVIPEFMVQGGDPMGNGTGGPGYKFQDEFDPSLKFDKPAMLAMANAGPGTNGSQFFITEKPTPWLTGRHTIFGECDNVELVKSMTRVERGPRDRPRTDIVLKHVRICRGEKSCVDVK
ncbi:MAG: peptidylprolyl isomerase [Myxococcota bacterium]